MNVFYESRNEPNFIGNMTESPFPLHVHEIVELVLILKGGCTIQLDGRSYDLKAGDAAIAFPLTPHSFDVIEPGTNGLSAFFPADTIAEFTTTFHTMLPDEPVLRGAYGIGDVKFAVQKLLGVSSNQSSPLRIAYLNLLLAHILSNLSFHPVSDYRDRGLGARCIRYVYDHACEEISVSTTARYLGISESHLSHMFAQQFQVNFRHFINAIRIDKATMLMRDPFMTLTQIYFQCGYDNARTFRRSFVRETGMLPAAFSRSVLRRGLSGEDAGREG